MTFLSKAMNVELDDYQIDAISKLKNGCILCGGTGSGKSRTAVGYYFKEQGGQLVPFVPMKKDAKDLYIITTAKKRDTCEWEGDLSPFLLSPNPEVSYYNNKVTVDSWNNIKKYVNVSNSFFIFDEQRVVGSGTWVKSFLKITQKNDWILATATPGDSWKDYIPVFIANGFYKNRTEFYRRHVIFNYYAKFPQISKYINQSHLLKLRNEILVNMKYKRPTVSHVNDIQVEYDKVKYMNVVKTRWNIYKDRPIKNVSEYCQLLRRIVNTDLSRQEAFLELTFKHPKIIVYYNFDYELEILRSLPYKAGTIVAEWNGHKHEVIPKSERWIYLVNYQDGSEGWNCIETDTMVFYSLNYSYKTSVQASGRIDRRNTKFTDLYYYRLKSNASIDIGILTTLKKKKNFNEKSFVA